MQWDIVIGLEVHVQLLTQSKLFSASPNQFGAEPNEHASLIDLGFPGTLPVLNRAAVEQAIKFGVAVGAEIHPLSVFERKNYFYPDLPKGYQTSQFEAPIVIGGEINAPLDSNADNTVQLTRAHLEEDAGKSTHRSNDSGIDLNRAGTPLLEIVTEPCIHSVEEALSYLRNLHQLVQYLEICDGNMQ
jgi:aspartyl-tRNA(Asn)/glutamyl-tRNA(Gln) amidotransferase subunit B